MIGLFLFVFAAASFPAYAVFYGYSAKQKRKEELCRDMEWVRQHPIAHLYSEAYVKAFAKYRVTTNGTDLEKGEECP